MGSKRTYKEWIVICDLNNITNDFDDENKSKIKISPLTVLQNLKKEKLFEFREKTLSVTAKSNYFDFGLVSNGSNLMDKVLKRSLLCIPDSAVDSGDIFQEHGWKDTRILFIHFHLYTDTKSFSVKVFDLSAIFKTLSSLGPKGEYATEVGSSPNSRTIDGPPCQNQKSAFQMLSPMFSKLMVSVVDKLTPSPDRSHSRTVRRLVPRDRDGSRPIQTPRSLLFAVLGWSGNAPTVTIEAYDPLVRKWFYVSQDGFIKRAYHGVVMLGILIYVIGGFDGRLCFNSVFCFDVQGRRWYRRSSLHVPRCYVTALGYKGSVYAIGGYDGDERFRSCERFDPRTRKWEYFAGMNERRSDASGAVHKGKVYVCGGFNGMQILTTAEMYDHEHDQWTLVPSMLCARSGHVMASYRNVLFAIGGFDGEKRLRTTERLDDAEGKWSRHVPMLSPRSNFAAAILEDKLHVIGGYNGENTFPKVERYDDVTKEWHYVRSLNKHRSAHGACVFNESMIVSMCAVTGHITVRTVNMEQSSP